MKALHDVSFPSGYTINDDRGDEGRLMKDVVDCVVRAMKRVPLEVAKHSVGLDESYLTASSSGSSLQRDIFINHRGVDVKHKLASTFFHIFNLLGLRAFLDVEVLEAGDVIPVEIQAAMAHSSLLIAIFSPNYAQSPWCLAELSFMLKTGTKIIPIFYHVDPSDLRWIDQGKGIYAEAFSQHQEKGRYTSQKLQEWMKALKDVSFRSGYMINDDSGDEGSVLKNVVNCVLNTIKRVPLEVAKYPVGMDEAVTNFERNALQSAQKHRNVKIEGIVDMGGSGKTTLAKELFNRKSSLFERCSFIFDVRAAAQTDLHKQKKLIQDLGISKLSFDNVEDGKAILSSSLRSVCALIVLDDVDHIDQLDALLPNLNNLGYDSLVIVTTRELGVLMAWDIYSIYKMPGLNDLQAMQLFCWHAFLQPFPLSGFEILVEGFLKACNGLPLSLKVLGGQLYRKNSKDYWQSQLNKISRILPSDIIQRLRVSFDALDEEEQEMFLDVACFLIGEAKSLAIAVWDGSGWSGLHGLETLVNKCLVELIYDCWNHIEKIRMHDHLRDMGRVIATTRSPCRYWSPQQILNIQKPSEERRSIRGISSKTSKTFVGTSRRGFKWLGSSLSSQIFLVSGNELTEEIVSQSKDLVWLHWNSIPHRILPSWVPLRNLAVLQISSRDMEELWGDNVDPPLKLIELDIAFDRSLQRFPPSIGRLMHLKKIILRSNPFRTHHIISLPEEFCDLQSLEHLELWYFDQLSSLPVRFGELTNLRHITLVSLRWLKLLPRSFKHLINLEWLDLSFCVRLELRSDMLENIKKLEYLNLYSCEIVEDLPSQITNQVSLKELKANQTSLEYLPNDIGQLHNLNDLSIGSHLLTSLPTSLGNLSSLTCLYIDCMRLTSLPSSLGNLSCLTNLTIESSLLTSLPSSLGNLSSLTDLFIQCPLLTSLPSSLGNLSSLTSLHIRSLPLVSLLRQLGNLCCTTNLLTSLPSSLGNLSSLRSLRIENSTLTSLPICLGNLCCLTDLSIDCPLLTSLPFSLTSRLTSFFVNCDKLESIPRCIRYAVNLRQLHISDCWELDELASLADLALLKDLRMVNYPKVSRIEGIQHCTSLEKLEAKTSWKLPGIQSLEKVERLKELSLRCHNISAIKPCVQSMKKCPCRMEIEGRVFGFVQTIINSLEFLDLRVMKWEEMFNHNRLLLYFPNFLCYLERKEEDEAEEEEDVDEDEDDEEDEEEEEEEEEEDEEEEEKYSEGIHVHIAVFRQAPKHVVGRYFQSRSSSYLNFCDSRGVIVAGDEAKVVEAFYKIFALLE